MTLVPESTALGDFLRLALDRLGDGITVQDPSGALVYANESGARLSGFETVEELMSTPVADVVARFELLDEHNRPLALGDLPGRRALRGEYPEELLVQVRSRSSPEVRWSIVQALPVLDEAGQVLYAVNVFRDVTERVESERRQRFLAEASDLLTSSLDGEEILVNLAELTVPALADWCIVYVAEEGRPPRVLTRVHEDPEQVRMAEEVSQRYSPTSGVIQQVIATGEPMLVPEITEEMLAGAAQDEEHLELLRSAGLASFLAVPLAGRSSTYGAVALITAASKRRYGDLDLALAADLGRRAGLAIDNSALLRTAEQVAESLRKLEQITQTALSHVAHEDLLEALLRQIAVVLEADTSVLLLLDEERAFLNVHAAYGFDHEIEEARPIPYGGGMAGRIAAETNPVVIENLREIELASPHLRRRGIASLIAIPLMTEGRVIGVAHAGSVHERFFDERDLRLFELMADRLALALTQLQLFEAERAARRDAERAHRRLSFLAEASTILASSLDYETTLRSVARLVVPHLADWCAVHITAADGRLACVALAHAELAAEELERLDLPLLWAGDGAPVGPAAVARAGAAELVPDVGPEARSLYGDGPDGAEKLERIGFASYLCVPMRGHERVLGTITFAAASPARAFGEADLALAEELGRRMAVAVENAMLFREAEERGRAARVLHAVADGVFLVDAQGVVRLWNPAAEALTGLSAADVLDRPAAEAIAGWAAVSPRIGVGADIGAAAARAETVPLELGGRELWLSITGVGFADGTVYAFRDLTQERALEELKGEFVSTVSHELRTPLAAIYGAAMTLQRPDVGADSEHGSRLLDVIARESERLATIVNDILLASRLDSDAVHLAIESVDAAGLARSVLASAEVNRPENVRLALTAPPELPRVAADPDKARQVLVNLVDNAIKYSPDGGLVEIELSCGPASMRFAVHDQGLGIPPAEQRRVFEKFYRLDPNMTRGVGGTGLGLYICRELVQRMQGRIWVVSPRAGGVGSTFAFELPSVPGTGTVPGTGLDL